MFAEGTFSYHFIYLRLAIGLRCLLSITFDGIIGVRLQPSSSHSPSLSIRSGGSAISVVATRGVSVFPRSCGKAIESPSTSYNNADEIRIMPFIIYLWKVLHLMISVSLCSLEVVVRCRCYLGHFSVPYIQATLGCFFRCAVCVSLQVSRRR